MLNSKIEGNVTTIVYEEKIKAGDVGKSLTRLNPIGKVMVNDIVLEGKSSVGFIDENSEIVVCAAGRASSYLATFALLLGLDIRVGMEDTVWMWPHRNELVKNNVEVYKMFEQLVKLLGREIYTADEFRARVGMNNLFLKTKK